MPGKYRLEISYLNQNMPLTRQLEKIPTSFSKFNGVLGILIGEYQAHPS